MPHLLPAPHEQAIHPEVYYSLFWWRVGRGLQLRHKRDTANSRLSLGSGCPKGLNSQAVDALKAGPPGDFQHEGNQRRRPDDCCEHPTHQIDPCRRLGEPSQGNFKVLRDQTEVFLVCLIGFEGCEVVIIRHAHFLGEAGYAIITRRGSAERRKPFCRSSWPSDAPTLNLFTSGGSTRPRFSTRAAVLLSFL